MDSTWFNKDITVRFLSLEHGCWCLMVGGFDYVCFFLQMIIIFYRRVMTDVTIEHGHRNSKLSHEKWWILAWNPIKFYAISTKPPCSHGFPMIYHRLTPWNPMHPVTMFSDAKQVHNEVLQEVRKRFSSSQAWELWKTGSGNHGENQGENQGENDG